jgi:hypothetical protein
MRRIVLRGKIEDGKIVLDETTPLPEGATVEVCVIPPRPTGPFQPDPELMKYSGILEDLPPDASQNVDRILYGDRSE